jgi:glycosyltransferase involved in cell wall biosynthesis
MEDTWSVLRAESERVEVNEKVADVRLAYRRLDIVFCPSRNESFCRVAAEAMMNGLPVVASDIEPLRALLGNDEAGILFPVDDVASASAALTRLVADPALRFRLGAVGRKRAHAFEPGAIADQLLDLYGVA